MVTAADTEAFWFGTAAVVPLQQPVQGHFLRLGTSGGWQRCLAVCTDPSTISTVLLMAFPHPECLPRHQLRDLATGLLNKWCGFASGTRNG